MMNLCVRHDKNVYYHYVNLKYFGFDNKFNSIAFSPLLAFRGIREGYKTILEKYKSA